MKVIFNDTDKSYIAGVMCKCMMVITTVDAIICFWLVNQFGFAVLDMYSWIADAAIDLFGIRLCGMLLYSCYMDGTTDKSSRSLMRLISMVEITMFCDFADGFIESIDGFATLTKIIVTIDYLNYDMIIIFFCHYIFGALRNDKSEYRIRTLLCHVLVFLGMCSTIINYFFGFCFDVDKYGHRVDGPYDAWSDLNVFIIYCIILFSVLANKQLSKSEKRILLTFEILPIVATVILAFDDSYSLVYAAMLLSIMIIYINFYHRRSQQLLKQQVILNEQATALMVSQIQPHFLYNSLTTITDLCYEDPEKAAETTVRFSQYLRTNLDSIRKPVPVPFEMELEHIKTYLYLEKMRFEDRLDIVYDIEETRFKVPSLGLQPIAENSVKHGICEKGEPGTLIISTRKVEGGYEVVIEDDGVGFDTNAPVKEDGRSHVGMNNVRDRLKNMCNADMIVESSPGNGCRTTVIFPESCGY